MIGLALGVAALILTSNILTGFEETLSEKIAGFDGHIRIQHFMSKNLPVHSPEMDRIKQRSVSSNNKYTILPYVQKPAMIRHGSRAEGILVEGVSGNVPEELIVEGKRDLSGNSIVIGRRLAEMMHIGIGDKVALFDLESMTGPLGARRIASFTISGLFHSGLQEYDRSLVYLDFSAAQKLFAMEDQASGWIIHSADLGGINSLAKEFEEFLPYPFFVQTFKDKHQILFTWLHVQKWPIFILFGLIALVGLVNIVSALAMIVFEKTSDVGALKALGMSGNKLRYIFLIKGTMIGLGGSLLGLLAALGIGYLQNKFSLIPIPEEVYFMDRIPIATDSSAVAVIFVLAVLGSIAASLWPTIRAAKIQPAQALRYE